MGKLIFHLLIYFHHTYLQQVLEMYYNKNTGTTRLQTTDLYVSLQNGFLKSSLLWGRSGADENQLSSLEEMVQASRSHGVKPQVSAPVLPPAREDPWVPGDLVV